MTLRAYKIPPLVLLTTVLALAVGELVCGTGLYFVTMMTIAMISIGITYNMLGGLSRISGFMFAAMAAASIVISQFAKVILQEPADQHLDAPHLTITVYAVFYFCAMVGVLVFGWVRLRLPKPHESRPGVQTRVLYFVSLIVGAIASVAFWRAEFGTVEQQATLAHSLGLAFSYLLLFSIVLAVDRKITETDGRHSLSVWVVLSALVVAAFQYLGTSRQGLAMPVVIYLLSCYVRGYRFKARHYIAALIGVVAFVAIISPFELYSRGLMSYRPFGERITEGRDLLLSPPRWKTIWDAELAEETGGGWRDEYYEHRGTFVLSRFSLIRADSDLIAACSSGFHYGFTALRMDLLRDVPRALYRDKPDVGSAVYMQNVIGIESDSATNWDFTSVSDAFGAFSWFGVVLVPILLLPAIFVVYDSMFDVATPWGTVALGMGVLHIWGIPISGLMQILIKDPVSLWLLSVLVTGITRFVAIPGESAGSKRERALLGGPEARSFS